MRILLTVLLLQAQYSTPEGPDGLVYKSDYKDLRFATMRKGKWDVWRVRGYQGGAGKAAPVTPAEGAQMEAHLKKIAAVVESTPYAQAQTGWYADRSVGWQRATPVRGNYGLFPFHLMDARKNGVWGPDWRQETVSIYYNVNGELPDTRERAVLQETSEDGTLTRFYADPRPETTFHGYPVYDGDVVITRGGRPLFVPVRVDRAMRYFLPKHRADRKSAEERLAMLKGQLAEAEAPAFAAEAMAAFEKEYGSYRATRPQDYEHRKKTRMDWIERERAERRAAATPVEGTAKGAWYWTPVRALEAAERLAASGRGGEAACFVAGGEGLYEARGQVVVEGPGCKPLMEPNPGYYDPALARTAPQLLTITSVKRCLDTAKNPAVALPVNDPIPHGCAVHTRIWEEMDWRALAAVLAP